MAMCARLGEKRLLLPVKCHSFDVNRQSQIHTEKKQVEDDWKGMDMNG